MAFSERWPSRSAFPWARTIPACSSGTPSPPADAAWSSSTTSSRSSRTPPPPSVAGWTGPSRRASSSPAASGCTCRARSSFPSSPCRVTDGCDRPLRRPRPRAAAGLRPRRRQSRRRGRGGATAGRTSARHRAGGRAGAGALSGATGRQAARPVPGACRSPRRVGAPGHAQGGDRLVVGPARALGAGRVRPVLGVRGRLHARGGRGGARPLTLARRAPGDGRDPGARRQEPAAHLGAQPSGAATTSRSRTSGCTSASTSTPRRSCVASRPGAERACEERHGRYFARFGTEDALEALFRHGGVQRRRVLALELENLVAACRRAVGRGDGAVAIAAYRAAWEVLELHGPFTLGVALGVEVLALPGVDASLGAAAALTLAQALRRTGRFDEARIRLTQAAIRRLGGGRPASGSPCPQQSGSPAPRARPDDGGARTARAGPRLRFRGGRPPHRGPHPHQPGPAPPRAGPHRRGTGTLRGRARHRPRDGQPSRRGHRPRQPRPSVHRAGPGGTGAATPRGRARRRARGGRPRPRRRRPGQPGPAGERSGSPG